MCSYLITGRSVVTESFARVQLQSVMWWPLVVCSVLTLIRCSTVVCDATPCSLVVIYQRFGGIYRLCHQGISHVYETTRVHI
jgi:hypothetical protein